MVITYCSDYVGVHNADGGVKSGNSNAMQIFVVVVAALQGVLRGNVVHGGPHLCGAVQGGKLLVGILHGNGN